MNFDEYQEQAQKFGKPLDDDEQVKRAIFGLCGEVGELAETFKKEFYQGHPRAKVSETANEIGDILWYLQDLCEAIGLRLEVAAWMNIRKLSQRYPEGYFRMEDSLGRVDGR